MQDLILDIFINIFFEFGRSALSIWLSPLYSAAGFPLYLFSSYLRKKDAAAIPSAGEAAGKHSGNFESDIFDAK